MCGGQDIWDILSSGWVSNCIDAVGGLLDELRDKGISKMLQEVCTSARIPSEFERLGKRDALISEGTRTVRLLTLDLDHRSSDRQQVSAPMSTGLSHR